MQRKKNGFTLVELLVVIAVLGFLMAIFFPNFLSARQRARDSRRKADLQQLQRALELYKQDRMPQEYPQTNFDETMCNQCWSYDGFAPGDQCTGTVYMKKFPCDPGFVNPGIPYVYTPDPADTLRYTLVTCLENSADLDRDTTLNGVCTTGASYTLTEP